VERNSDISSGGERDEWFGEKMVKMEWFCHGLIWRENLVAVEKRETTVK
jgi:hypothetical protein